jgi:hypothetical protein
MNSSTCSVIILRAIGGLTIATRHVATNQRGIVYNKEGAKGWTCVPECAETVSLAVDKHCPFACDAGVGNEVVTLQPGSTLMSQICQLVMFYSMIN